MIKGLPRVKDLVINVPPGTSKSTIVSICLNAWMWIHNPTIRFLTTSYSPDLAGDHAKATRRLIESEWYQGLFGDVYKLEGKAETFFETNHGGRRMITSPGSAVGTGFHGDVLIFDDPDAAQKVYSSAQRAETRRWFDEVMPSRLSDPEVSLKIVVQQRLHQQDTTGHIRKNYSDKWFFIILPAIASNVVHPPVLREHYKNSLLFPARLTPQVLDDYRKHLRNGFAGQMLMTPLNEGGNFFKEHWPKWFTKEQVPGYFEQVIISVDASFSATEDSCPASIQVWGKSRPNYYMLYDLTIRMGAIETANAVERIANLYKGCTVVIEKAANGYFLIERLEKKFPVYKFDPKKYGGKEVRAEMVLPLWETGNIYIFDNQHNRNIYFTEILNFPSGEYKDRVDAMSQALLYFTRAGHGMGGVTNQIRGF